MNSQQIQRFENYSFRILTQKQKKQTIQFLKAEFIRNQPTQVSFYRQFPQRISESHHFWQRLEICFSQSIFDKGYSMGCYDMSRNDELIGVTIAKDFSYTPSNEPDYPEGHFIFACKRLKEKLFAAIIPEYFSLINQCETPMIDLWLAALKDNHKKKGILLKMTILNEMLARKDSFQYSVCWVANKYSLDSLKKLGYQKAGEIDLKDFEYNGTRYFKAVDEDQRHQYLWIKSLKQDKNAFASPKL